MAEEKEKLRNEYKEVMYDVLFHYNHHTNQWSCFSREDSRCYFNGSTPQHPIGQGTSVEQALLSYLNNCSICGQPIGVDTNGWTGGHNAQPINDGRCCESCNWNVVLPERLGAHKSN